MIMKNSIRKALKIATDAHRGFYDRSGAPYINHPYTVSKMVKGRKAKIVALLHDVLEDSDVKLETLEKFFTKDVCEAVVLLTKKKNQNYFTYINKFRSKKFRRYHIFISYSEYAL